jgi:RNA polymerase sigma factor (sigma-70 family)
MDRKVDASDLVQKVQYRAAAQFSKFRGRSIGEFRAWMSGILDRQVFRQVRFWGEPRRDRTREEPLSPAWGERGEPAGSSTSILDRLAHEEECERLRLAASWCREDDMAIISRHLFDGRSHEEIADELGIAHAAVRQRHCRAVRRVGEAMRLLDLMTRRGLGTLQQDVIGIHRFQGAAPGQIADRLGLPEKLVARWVTEARPLFRAVAKDRP